MPQFDLDAILESLGRLAIGHPQAKFVYRELDNLCKRGVRGYQAYCMTLVGPTGTGKTWTLKRFADERNAEVSGETRGGVEELPVVYVTAPNFSSEKYLAEKILSALGDPAAAKGSRDSQAERLRRRAEALGTRLIIIDEAQHLVDTRMTKPDKIRQTAEWMKNLLFESPCAYVYAGLESTEHLVKTNEQLARRCRGAVKLDGFPYTSRDEKAFFAKIVDSFVRAAGLPLDVDHKHIYAAIHRATDGRLGSLSQLFERALDEANTLDLASIDGRCLAGAWNFTPLREISGSTKKITHNPFREFVAPKRKAIA